MPKKDDGLVLTFDSKQLDTMLKLAQKRAPEKTTRAVHSVLLDLAGRSARRAPVKEGHLRNDCQAVLNGNPVFENQAATGGKPKSALSAFGTVGYSLVYARRQHEDLTFNHPMGGEAKFLENPFNENTARYEKMLRGVAEEVLKK
ncbi:MAG: hypothetical protein FWE40_05455 [Oscillospiraceae bacterium]|jgi:hypothetical protein|nr:hypothetical protein [Oscillospiraceae bacterium]